MRQCHPYPGGDEIGNRKGGMFMAVAVRKARKIDKEEYEKPLTCARFSEIIEHGEPKPPR
jgi:hypothetical protein